MGIRRGFQEEVTLEPSPAGELGFPTEEKEDRHPGGAEGGQSAQKLRGAGLLLLGKAPIPPLVVIGPEQPGSQAQIPSCAWGLLAPASPR